MIMIMTLCSERKIATKMLEFRKNNITHISPGARQGCQFQELKTFAVSSGAEAGSRQQRMQIKVLCNFNEPPPERRKKLVNCAAAKKKKTKFHSPTAPEKLCNFIFSVCACVMCVCVCFFYRCKSNEPRKKLFGSKFVHSRAEESFN